MQKIIAKCLVELAFLAVVYAPQTIAQEVIETIKDQALIEPAQNPLTHMTEWPDVKCLADRLCREQGYEKAVKYQQRTATDLDFTQSQRLKLLSLALTFEQTFPLHTIIRVKSRITFGHDLEVIKVIHPNSGQSYVLAHATCKDAPPQNRWVYYKNDYSPAHAELLTDIECQGDESKLKEWRTQKSLKAANEEWIRMSF